MRSKKIYLICYLFTGYEFLFHRKGLSSPAAKDYVILICISLYPKMHWCQSINQYALSFIRITVGPGWIRSSNYSVVHTSENFFFVRIFSTLWFNYFTIWKIRKFLIKITVQLFSLSSSFNLALVERNLIFANYSLF